VADAAVPILDLRRSHPGVRATHDAEQQPADHRIGPCATPAPAAAPLGGPNGTPPGGLEIRRLLTKFLSDQGGPAVEPSQASMQARVCGAQEAPPSHASPSS